jgi:tRNA nucleotidyltransferase (CCA-adding enzyme)
MEVYLVGGAVRDELLGRSVHERDWVVVGSTPAEMTRLGYRQVGRDFPVFLHPETGEEYALARTERKSGPGHTGFIVHADTDVTLEEDLIRRDLTINAIARDGNGELIDPYGGQSDLNERILRHVSPAFSEDPLRVFRVARFLAQLDGFSVAPETLQLMREMSGQGALAELSAERVWVELHKALSSAHPEAFFSVLQETGALEPWFAELVDCAIRIPESLLQPGDRYAALVGPLGADAVQSLGERIKCPRGPDRLAILVANFARVLATWRQCPPERVYEALQASRAFKKQSVLPELLRVIAAIASVESERLLELVADIETAVTVPALQAEGFQGAALGKALDSARIAVIAANQSA